MPTYTNSTINEILNIASFEVIPIGDIAFGQDEYGLKLSVIEIPENDGEELIDRADEIGYGSYYFIVNMGTLVFAFLGSLIFPLIMYMLLKPCVGKSKNIAERHHRISSALRGNILIRYILEASLDICLCAVLQIQYSDLNGGFNFNSSFEIINTILAILLGSATAIFLPFTIIFFIKNFSRWED